MITIEYFLGLTFLFFISINSINNSSSKSDYLAITTVIQEKTALEKSIENGKEVYMDFCIQCHMANGQGDGMNFPPLDGSSWLKKNITQSIHAVKFGQTGEILVNGKKYNNTMPPMGLSNQEIADVLNYVRNSWSNKLPKRITPKQVEAIKQ